MHASESNANANGFCTWQNWNRIGGPKYPLDQVVRYCFRNYPREARGNTEVLDLGCGSGVHTVFLSDEGFRVTAIDISEVGIDNTAMKLKSRSLNADLRVESVDTLDFPLQFFDLVICIGVYDCCGPVVAGKSVERIKEVLKTNGNGLFIFASDKDMRVQEKNVEFPIHGYTDQEVHQLFEIGFSKVWFDRMITTYGGGSVEQNNWIVTLRR